MGVLEGLILKTLGVDLFERWFNFTGVEKVTIPVDLQFTELNVKFGVDVVTDTANNLRQIILPDAVINAQLRGFYTWIREGFGDSLMFIWCANSGTCWEYSASPGFFAGVHDFEIDMELLTRCDVTMDGDLLTATSLNLAKLISFDLDQAGFVIGKHNSATAKFVGKIYYLQIRDGADNLLASYNHDETTGTVSNDVSGNGEDGVIALGGSSEASFFSGS